MLLFFFFFFFFFFYLSSTCLLLVFYFFVFVLDLRRRKFSILFFASPLLDFSCLGSSCPHFTLRHFPIASIAETYATAEQADSKQTI